MIFGHLAVVGIAKQTYFQKDRWVFLAVVAFGPDILDKTASIFLGLPRRGIGHSLILFLAVASAGWLFSSILRRGRNLLVPGAVMWFSHLAGDFPEWPLLFWPFLGLPEPSAHFDFWEKFYQYYVVRLWPEQFWLEIFCIVLALGLMVARSVARTASNTVLARNLPDRQRGGAGK